jgi:hypothetical protein
LFPIALLKRPRPALSWRRPSVIIVTSGRSGVNRKVQSLARISTALLGALEIEGDVDTTFVRC